MNRFFSLLREKKFIVKYDKCINETSINFEETHSVNFEEICNHIIRLDCHNNQLTEIPELLNLQWLDCHNNQLRELPELPNLKELYCHSNQLTKLPELPNLQILYCYYNQLTKLPELPNAEKICCGFNHLSELPQLPNVKELYCRSNQLIKLTELSNVQRIDCANNQLNKIPELPNVKTLWCYDNQLFSNKLYKWEIIWKFKRTLIKVYVVPKLFIRWKLTTIRNRLSVEHKEAIICHPKTYYVRELYNENNIE